MPLLEGDILRCTPQIKNTALGSRFQNVFTYAVTGFISDVFADIQNDFALQMNTLYNTIEPMMTADNLNDGVKLLNITRKETYGVFPWTFAGSNVGTDDLPAQICAEVLAYTKDSGRFGRKYLGPMVESEVTDGVWSAAMQAALSGFAGIYIQQFVGGVTGNTYTAGVARKVGAAYVFQAFAGALGTQVITYARTQRRRTPGYGLT